MKLLYLHSNSLDTSTADMHQAVSMCNAFAAHVKPVYLSVPFAQSTPEVLINHAKEFYKKINFEIVFRNITKIEQFGKYLGIKYTNTQISEINPDILYTRDPSSLPSCVNSGIPTYFEAHNNRIHQYNDILNKWWSNYLLKVSKLERVYLVTISQALKDFWIDYGIDERKIIALHDGFDEEMFNVNIDKNTARQKLGIPLDSPIAVYTGNLLPDREIDKVVYLAKQVPQADFIVVGGPESQKKVYEQLAIREDVSNIHFKGHVDHSEIPDYLAAGDIYLALWSKKVITINYCSPLKVFEYMASGKTIVAHAFPTIKEVLRHNENALLVEPGSIDDLIVQMKKALTLYSENHLGITARSEAFKHYTWSGRAKTIIQHFDEVFGLKS